MSARASYSLFPPSEEVLKRQESKRMSRARTASGTLKQRSASAHSSTGDNHSLFEENRASTESKRPSTDSQRPSLASKSIDDLASKVTEQRRDSTLNKLSGQKPYRRKLDTDLPTIYSPSADQTEHPKSAPVDSVSPIGPPPSRALPLLPKPTPTVNTTALKPPSKPAAQSNGTHHARNLTNSTVTSVTKPSPVTPDTQTSGPSIFSPITPPSAGPSPVKYPTIPRLSSSPAPSAVEAFSPPRRSHSRSTNHSQTTTADLISSYAHTRDGSYGRTGASSRLQRAPSNATARTGVSQGTATPRPSTDKAQPPNNSNIHPAIRSIFPTYNEQQQQPKQYTPQFHLPSQRIESKPYSHHSQSQQSQRSLTPSLTREALEAHNASQSGSPAPGNGPSEPPKEPTETVSEFKPPSSFPPRSQSLPRHKAQAQTQGKTFLDTASVSSSKPPTQAPTFPPPPRREASVRSGRARAVLRKPQPPPKDSDSKSKTAASTTVVGSDAVSRKDMALSPIHEKQPKKSKAGNPADQKTKTLDFQLPQGAYRAATSATTRYDKDLDAVTTTATTTIVNVPNKSGPLHGSTQPGFEGYRKIVAGEEFSKEEVDLQHQHSVAVALGAVAFVMGAGVELVGGAVNGVKGGFKPGKRGKKAIEAA